jgi:hypothetical protein
VWEQIVHQRGIAEMIRAGYLADVRGLRVGLEAVDLDQVAQSGGDYQAEALGTALEQASAPRHVLAAYQRHAVGRKTLVFVPTVALAYRSPASSATPGSPPNDSTATPHQSGAARCWTGCAPARSPSCSMPLS